MKNKNTSKPNIGRLISLIAANNYLSERIMEEVDKLSKTRFISRNLGKKIKK